MLKYQIIMKLFFLISLFFYSTFTFAQWTEVGGFDALSANQPIYAVCSDSLNNIYAAGDFTNTNGSKYVAKWDGASWNELGGQNGIGRVDMVENRYVGMKSRGVYETPGGTILHIAHRAVESLTMDREVMHFRDSLIPKISELIYYGYWFSPEMEVMKKMIDETQKDVTGTVRLKLYKGNCTILGRKSEKSLYHDAFATFEKDTVYNQQDAEGFIRLNALRLRIRRMMRDS